MKAIPNSYWFVKEAAAIRGISDIIGLIQGRFVALEVKRDLQEASKRTGRIVLQKHFLRQVREAGGFAELIYPENEEEILQRLQQLSRCST